SPRAGEEPHAARGDGGEPPPAPHAAHRAPSRARGAPRLEAFRDRTREDGGPLTADPVLVVARGLDASALRDPAVELGLLPQTARRGDDVRGGRDLDVVRPALA